MPDVAMTLYNFALLHQQNNLEKAEAETLECLEIYQRMTNISDKAFVKAGITRYP